MSETKSGSDKTANPSTSMCFCALLGRRSSGPGVGCSQRIAEEHRAGQSPQQARQMLHLALLAFALPVAVLLGMSAALSQFTGRISDAAVIAIMLAAFVAGALALRRQRAASAMPE